VIARPLELGWRGQRFYSPFIAVINCDHTKVAPLVEWQPQLTSIKDEITWTALYYAKVDDIRIECLRVLLNLDGVDKDVPS